MSTDDLISQLSKYVLQISVSDISSVSKTCGLNESILLHLSKVGLYFSNQRLYSHDQGTLILSTHKLIWIPTSASNSFQQQTFGFELPLICIQEVQSQKGKFRSSPKLKCLVSPLPSIFMLTSWTCSTCDNLNPMSRTYPPLCSHCGMSTRVCSKCHYANNPHEETCHACESSLHLFLCPQCTLCYTPSALTTSCNICHYPLPPSQWVEFAVRGSGNVEQFHDELLRQLEKQGGESNQDKIKSAAGVHGLVQRQQLLNDTQQSNLETAFTDLNALMSKAKEMVELANTLNTKLQDVPKDEVTQFRSSMLEFGLSSFDISFESTLVHELTQFLKQILPEEGIMALVDVYCMFNRAKGTSFISPQDLWAASQQLQPPYHVTEFHSGARMIHTTLFSKGKLYPLLKEKANPSIDAKSLSVSMAIQLSLANELLQEAAVNGIIVIDHLSQHYFQNLFL